MFIKNGMYGEIGDCLMLLSDRYNNFSHYHPLHVFFDMISLLCSLDLACFGVDMVMKNLRTVDK